MVDNRDLGRIIIDTLKECGISRDDSKWLTMSVLTEVSLTSNDDIDIMEKSAKILKDEIRTNTIEDARDNIRRTLKFYKFKNIYEYKLKVDDINGKKNLQAKRIE